MIHSIKKALLLTAGASALMTGTTGYAADEETATLGEVVVTAERREQDVQKIAASVSVRSGEDLEAQGRYTLAQILESIPGVQGGAAANAGVGGGSGTDSPANGVVIRGIRSNLGVGGSITSTASSAAAYVDDIYQGIGGNYDIGRVEVLRGPQGTLYGRSAVSGAVGTYTRNPEFDRFGGFASVEFGGNDVGAQNVQHYTGAVNIPFTDQLAVRVAGNRYKQGGLWRDRSSGQNDQSAAKVKILFKPTDNLSILVGGAFENNTSYSGSTGVTITQPSPDNVVFTETAITSYYPGTNKYRQIWAKLDWNLGFATLTYIPAVRKFENQQTVDNAASTECRTFTTNQLATAKPQPINCFTQPTLTPFDKFDTHEIRLASNNPTASLTWQAGGMYYYNELQNHTDNQFVSPIDGQNSWADSCFYDPPFCGNTRYLQYIDTYKETTSIGVFAEATYAFTDAMRLTAGLRYDDTKVKNIEFFYANGLPTCLGSLSVYVDLHVQGNPACTLINDSGVRTFRNTTWKLRLERDLSINKMVYATISTGASPGDVLVTTSAAGIPRILELKSQTLTSYAFGTKNRFLGDKLQFNAEVYYQDYGGYQAANIFVGNLGNGGFTTILVPVKFYGFDTELLYQLTPRDRVGLNVGYTYGWYVDPTQVVYTNGTVPVTLGEFFPFKQMEGVIPWTANLNYDHRFNLRGGATVNLHADARYTSGYYPARITRQNYLAGTAPYSFRPAAEVFNMNAQWTSANGKLSINSYIRNVFDNRYKTGGNNGCSLQTGVCTGTTNATIADPRSFGVMATIDF